MLQRVDVESLLLLFVASVVGNLALLLALTGSPAILVVVVQLLLLDCLDPNNNIHRFVILCSLHFVVGRSFGGRRRRRRRFSLRYPIGL